MTRVLLAAALLLFCTAGGCPGGGSPPSTDHCSSPATRGTVESVEIGPHEGAFAPWPDAHVAEVVYGPQGGAMIPMRLSVDGDGLDDCLAQTTRALGPGAMVLATDDGPLPFDDGLSTTIWLTFEYQTPTATLVHIEAMVGAVTTTRDVWVERRYEGQLPALPADPVVVAVGAFYDLVLSSPDPGLAFIWSDDPAIVEVPYGQLGIHSDPSLIQLRAVSAGTATIHVAVGDAEGTFTMTVE